jgi:hypothetical protein
MAHSLLLPLVALVSALVLVFDGRTRWLAVAAALAAGIWLAQATGWLAVAIRGVPLGTILAAVLAVAGAILITRTQRKMSIVAATLVTAIGAMQLAAHL